MSTEGLESRLAVTTHSLWPQPNTGILSQELVDYYKETVYTGNFLFQVQTLSMQQSGHKKEIE